MLAINVELLTGRYVATAYNDRTRAEWPPHPARLFSALAAAHFDEPTDAGRTALEWLERQDAPQIVAARTWSERDIHTVFVPVNDKASEPEARVRQPRTFPSVTPAEPRVQFVWPNVDLTSEMLHALDDLTGRVVRLGHSSSLVSVHLSGRSAPPTWRPDESGSIRLRVVGAGQLRALEDRFALHRETEPRVMPAAFQPYSDRPPNPFERPPSSLFTDEWLVFRRALKRECRFAPVTVPITATAGLARVVRRALMHFAQQPVPELVSGHQPDGQPSVGPHLAVVPLSSVGGGHGDGSVAGVALVLPREAKEEDRRALYVAIAAWEKSARGDLDDDRPSVPVNLGSAGVYEVKRTDPLLDDESVAALRASTWCRSSRRWLSATPIALDRNPGDLWARDPMKQKAALSDAREVIALSCERVGLPRPEGIEILPAAPLRGGAKARHYPPFPEESDRNRRVLVHAELTFEKCVAGPILIGAGRYLGLGLFRPVDHE